MLHGMIIEESLEDMSILDGLTVTKTEIEKIDNAVEGQPSTWTMHSFEIGEAEAADFAEKLSKSLKQGKWYVDFKSDKEFYVVFASKVTHYMLGDKTGKQQAVDYARSVGIPESQLDWE
jgi:hypothetical protein